jgi:hypothetical protein
MASWITLCTVPHRQIDAEEIAAEFVNPAIGIVADQRQAESGLLEPILGDRQTKEYLVVSDGERESLVQGSLRSVTLLIDKLAADAGVVGQIGDGRVPGQSLHAEGEPVAGSERFGVQLLGIKCHTCVSSMKDW